MACCVLLQKVGTLKQAVNLTGSTDASVTWQYFAPPALEIYIRPALGCADDSLHCLELQGKCDAGASAGVVGAGLVVHLRCYLCLTGGCPGVSSNACTCPCNGSKSVP